MKTLMEMSGMKKLKLIVMIVLRNRVLCLLSSWMASLGEYKDALDILGGKMYSTDQNRWHKFGTSENEKKSSV